MLCFCYLNYITCVGCFPSSNSNIEKKNVVDFDFFFLLFDLPKLKLNFNAKIRFKRFFSLLLTVVNIRGIHPLLDSRVDRWPIHDHIHRICRHDSA